MNNDNDNKFHIPHSEQAELGILSSVLVDPAILDDVILLIGESHFHLNRHRLMWLSIEELHTMRKPIDLITFMEQLVSEGRMDQVGGMSVPQEVFRHVPSSTNWRYYADILAEKKVRRDIISISYRYQNAAMDESGENTDILLDKWQTEVLAVSEAQAPEDAARHIAGGLEASVAKLEHAFENRGHPTGVTTGFHDFDRMTGGLHPDQMITIAARPAMGKTAFAMNIAENAALSGINVEVYSLEMSYEDLSMRMLCGHAGVSLQRARDGHFSSSDFPPLITSSGILKTAPIWIDDTAALTINEFRARARRSHKKRKIGLYVIDYIGLMKSTSKRADANRAVEISEISAGIKQTAKELGVPIVVLAQLNRNVEQRKGNRPKLSDLRESGSIEQDSDIVGMLYRAEYYYPDKAEVPDDLKGRAELIIAKHRNGPVGPIPLGFKDKLTRFENVTQSLYSNNPDNRQENYE